MFQISIASSTFPWTIMDWFTRFSLSFLVSIFTHSMIVVGQVSPWSSFENANAFVESFLDSVSRSGVFTQAQLDDMNSIGETIVRAMSVFKGNGTPNKLQALNTAFASAVAEIAISDSKGQNVEETTEAIANALSLAFYQTTGKSDDTFVNEMYSLINTFAAASANEVAYEPFDSVSASAKATASTSAEEMKTNVPVRTGEQETEVSASAVASAAELRLRAPSADPSARPNNSSPSGQKPDNNIPRKAEPRVALAAASATEEEYIPKEPDRVPAAAPTNRNPSGYKPNDNGPKGAEPERIAATASATATEEKYRPKEPDSVPVAAPTNRNPSGYRPSDNGPKGVEPKRIAATASATATLKEYRPVGNEMTKKAPATYPVSRPTDSGPRSNKPRLNVPGEAEPDEALTAASATATGRVYSPERNVEPYNIPLARSTKRGDPSIYKPNYEGPRETEPNKALVTASAAATEYRPERNEKPDRLPAAGSTNRSPSKYKLSDEGPREADRERVLATASAAVKKREYIPKRNEEPDTIPKANSAAEPTNRGPNLYKPSDNGSKEAEPEHEKPDRLPADDTNNLKPREEGPREAEPIKVLSTASVAATGREYNPRENEIPYRVPVVQPVAGPIDNSPIYDPNETEPEVISATATAKERKYIPERNEIIPEPKEYEPGRVPAAVPTSKPVNNGPGESRPRASSPKRVETAKSLASAAVLSNGLPYRPRGNHVIPEPIRQPDRTPDVAPTSEPTNHDPSEQKPSLRIAEPRQVLATASAAATIGDARPVRYEPVITRPYAPRQSSYVPVKSSAESAAASAVSAVDEPVYEPSDSNEHLPDEIESKAAASAVATDEPDRYKAVADSSAAASAISERRLTPIRYELSDIIASSAIAAASALSESVARRRISSTTSNLVSSTLDNVSNITKILANAISQVSATSTNASGCNILVQALFEIVTSLIHVLRFASIGDINYDDLNETLQMVAQSIYEVFD